MNTTLVGNLVASQFPEWKDLPIRPILSSGWDNRTFHLGEKMLIRMPMLQSTKLKLKKSTIGCQNLLLCSRFKFLCLWRWENLQDGYSWKWSIYCWIEGENVASGYIADLCEFATSLAEFRVAFQGIDSEEGPLPGLHSFYRGGALAIYDPEVRQALAILKSKIDINAATEVWETALKTTWHGKPVWVHGDVSVLQSLISES